jgi:protein gp37
MARRLEAMNQSKYSGTTRLSGGRAKWSGKINIDEKSLEAPFRWSSGRMIFVNSMSDLFHDDVPELYIKKVFDIMKATPHHTYQILTKRAHRLAELAPRLDWPPHIWMGVSVESAEYLYRIDFLRKVEAAVKFLSLEPLLGPLDVINLADIDWVIAGGESGPGARPVEKDWIRSVRDQCILADVPFHFKQWGGVIKKKTGRILDGRTWDEFPVNKSPACRDEQVL